MPDVARRTTEARSLVFDPWVAAAAPRDPQDHVPWGVAVYPTDGKRETELVSYADGDMYAHKARRGSPD